MEIEHLKTLFDKCNGDIDVFIGKVSSFMMKDSKKIVDLVFEIDKLRNADHRKKGE